MSKIRSIGTTNLVLLRRSLVGCATASLQMEDNAIPPFLFEGHDLNWVSKIASQTRDSLYGDINLLIYWFIDSLIDSLIHWFTDSLIHAFSQSVRQSGSQSINRSTMPWWVQWMLVASKDFPIVASSFVCYILTSLICEIYIC